MILSWGRSGRWSLLWPNCISPSGGTGQQLLEPSWFGTDCVIPFAMERSFLNLYGREFLVGHLDPGGIGVGVQLRLDMQPGLGLRVPDQVDDHGATQQRLAAPVLRDVAKHPMLDLVPLTRSGRE